MTSPDPEANEDAVSTAANWCVRLHEGGMSPNDQAALSDWLCADPAHEPLLERYLSIWRGVGDVATFPAILALRTDALDRLSDRSAVGVPARSWRRRASIAIAACLLIACGFAANFYSMRPIVYETDIGERRVVKLEDGSEITMDAATRVVVDYTKKSRELQLAIGRATFDVAKDARRPFAVSVGKRMVVATGTEFSVEKINGEMRVVLYEGNVDVLEGDATEGAPNRAQRLRRVSHSIEPGTTLVAALDGPETRVEKIDQQGSLAWEHGQIVFVDEPLALCAARINRYSKQRVLVDRGAERLLVSGAFNAGDTDSFVEGVSLLYGLRVIHEDGIIKLSQ